MAEGVVELLEVVDVDHEQGKGFLEALCARHLGGEALLEEPVVVDAGETVGARLLLELAVRASSSILLAALLAKTSISRTTSSLGRWRSSGS